MKRYLYLLEMPTDIPVETAATKADAHAIIISEVLRLANCFQLQALVDCCAKLFAAALTPANAIHRLNFALDQGLPKKVEQSTRAFVMDNLRLIQVPLKSCTRLGSVSYQPGMCGGRHQCGLFVYANLLRAWSCTRQV